MAQALLTRAVVRERWFDMLGREGFKARRDAIVVVDEEAEDDMLWSTTDRCGGFEAPPIERLAWMRA